MFSHSSDIQAFQSQWAQLSPRERFEVILKRTDAQEIVQQFPAQDLLVTFKEVGLMDCLEIVELLHAEQIQTLMDLDVWQRDQLEPARLAEWLLALFTADKEKAISHMMHIDTPFLLLLLKQFSHIYDLFESDEFSLPDGPHSITPDRHYLIVFQEDSLGHSLCGLLESLYEHHLFFVLRLVESVRWETVSALEHEAMSTREARMQDLGFCPLDTSLQILSFVDPDQVSLGKKTKESHFPPLSMHPQLILPYRFLEKHSLFADTIKNLPSSVQESLLYACVVCTNRLLIARGEELGSIRILQEAAQEILSTVEMGLGYLQHKHQKMATASLLEIPLQELFQIGRSIVLQLARQTKRRLEKEGFDFKQPNHWMSIDSPLGELIRGLLQYDPLYYAGLTDPERMDYVRFSSLTQVAAAAQAAAEAIFRMCFARALGIAVMDSKTGGQDDKHPTPPCSTLVATALCRWILSHELSALALTPDMLKALFHRLKEKNGTKELPQEDKERIQELVKRVIEKAKPFPGALTKEQALQRATPYVHRVLHTVEQELSDIQDISADPRYISTLLCR